MKVWMTCQTMYLIRSQLTIYRFIVTYLLMTYLLKIQPRLTTSECKAHSVLGGSI